MLIDKNSREGTDGHWLIETSAQFYAGKYDAEKYWKDGYTYTTVNPYLPWWQRYITSMVVKYYLIKLCMAKGYGFLES